MRSFVRVGNGLLPRLGWWALCKLLADGRVSRLFVAGNHFGDMGIGLQFVSQG